MSISTADSAIRRIVTHPCGFGHINPEGRVIQGGPELELRILWGSRIMQFLLRAFSIRTIVFGATLKCAKQWGVLWDLGMGTTGWLADHRRRVNERCSGCQWLFIRHRAPLIHGECILLFAYWRVTHSLKFAFRSKVASLEV